jgi:cation diffusion facilitator family transporter
MAMAASLGVAVVMLGGKITAYVITGSTAILSDAMESVVHIAATGFAAFSLWYAHLPASREHPYGRGKIAYFSAGFEGALILSAALFILYEASKALVVGPELRQLSWGLLITATLAIINLILGLSLVSIGKRTNTIILVANGKHVLTDMWTSVAVVGGVALVWATGIVWLDPIVAMCAGLQILVSARKLMRNSFIGLLDRADPEHSDAILDVLKAGMDDGTIVDFHNLRHRESNDVLWVEVHMLMPSSMTTEEAHRRVTMVEEAIRARIAKYQVHVTTHIEPAAHEVAHPEGHPGMEDPLH